MAKCKCGFDAKGGPSHLKNHLAFYARSPEKERARHGVA